MGTEIPRKKREKRYESRFFRQKLKVTYCKEEGVAGQKPMNKEQNRRVHQRSR